MKEPVELTAEEFAQLAEYAETDIRSLTPPNVANLDRLDEQERRELNLARSIRRKIGEKGRKAADRGIARLRTKVSGV